MSTFGRAEEGPGPFEDRWLRVTVVSAAGLVRRLPLPRARLYVDQ